MLFEGYPCLIIQPKKLRFTVRFTNPLVSQFTVFARFCWYNSCEGENVHIPSMGEWHQEAVPYGVFWKTAGC